MTPSCLPAPMLGESDQRNPYEKAGATSETPTKIVGTNPGGRCGVILGMTVVMTRPARVNGGSVRTSADPAEVAVHEVFVAHYGQLAGWAGHLMGDRDLGHDVATEAFARLLSHWTRVDDPRPWLFATAGNLVKDHWRKRGREASAYERLQGGQLDPDIAATGPDHAQLLSVREAVEALPDRLRLPVLLFYFADLSVAEVARQVGRSEGAIKRDLYDARARLATTLEEAR